MRKLLMAGLAAAAVVSATPALATNHGFCAMGSQCTDNGTNTPTPVNPPSFGFSADSGESGDLLLAILIPNNDPKPSSFSVTGYRSGTANLFSTTAWTSGQLDSYLGISASPTNPIGAYLPSTQSLDAGATGFFVFTVDLGQSTLPSNASANAGLDDSYLMTLDKSVPIGSYVVAFLNQGDSGIAATANSGAIFETGGVPEPTTWAMMLLGFGGIGMALRRNRRRSVGLEQVA